MKYAFLRGELNEEIFVEHPYGYMKNGNEQKIYKLKKALIDLSEHLVLGIVA